MTLIDAAIQLCHRQGFERTTVDQIAAVADVSPRTFSRYFATKDAVVFALIDDLLALVAQNLAAQPAGLGHVEALYRANIEAFEAAVYAPADGLTEERLLASARIVTSSATLMRAATEYSTGFVEEALARRMELEPGDTRVRMVGAVCGAVIMTALGDLGPDTDWGTMTVGEIVARIAAGYAQFVDLTAGVAQPV